MKYHQFPALFLLLCAACLPAFAGSLRVLAWDHEVAGRKLSLLHGESVTPIEYLHPAARTKPIKIPAEAKTLRLEASDRFDDEGKPLSVPIKIPAGISSPLLLVLPDKDSKAGVRTLVLEDDFKKFKWGTIRLLNITSQPLVFRWDKKAKALASSWKPVEVSPGGNSRNMEIILYREGNLKEPLYSSIWEHREDMRQLVFMVPSSDDSLGPVEFKFVPETRVPVESE